MFLDLQNIRAKKATKKITMVFQLLGMLGLNGPLDVPRYMSSCAKVKANRNTTDYRYQFCRFVLFCFIWHCFVCFVYWSIVLFSLSDSHFFGSFRGKGLAMGIREQISGWNFLLPGSVGSVFYIFQGSHTKEEREYSPNFLLRFYFRFIKLDIPHFAMSIYLPVLDIHVNLAILNIVDGDRVKCPCDNWAVTKIQVILSIRSSAVELKIIQPHPNMLKDMIVVCCFFPGKQAVAVNFLSTLPLKSSYYVFRDVVLCWAPLACCFLWLPSYKEFSYAKKP